MTSTDLPDDPSDTPQEEFTLPGFVSIRPDGAIIDLRALTLVVGGFKLSVSRLFTVITTKIIRFLPQSQALYRPVKLLEGESRAEYVF